MRTLTSVQSSTNVLLDAEFHLKASDASTTFIFGNNDIVTYPKINWEIDYTGGLGKSSNYNITLASSIGFLSENRSKIIKGQSFLKIFVNSDNFTPHVGRVRSINRDANNSNLFDLIVYDDFLDGDPLIPIEAVSDIYSDQIAFVNSYSSRYIRQSDPHPVTNEVDMGYPLYYGKKARPYYMTALDDNLEAMLGPRNVTSHTLVNSFIFSTGINTSDVVSFIGSWNQGSSGLLLMNVYSFYNTDIDAYRHSNPFELREIDPKSTIGIWFENPIINIPQSTTATYQSCHAPTVLEQDRKGFYFRERIITSPQSISGGSSGDILNRWRWDSVRKIGSRFNGFLPFRNARAITNSPNPSFVDTTGIIGYQLYKQNLKGGGGGAASENFDFTRVTTISHVGSSQEFVIANPIRGKLHWYDWYMSTYLLVDSEYDGTLTSSEMTIIASYDLTYCLDVNGYTKNYSIYGINVSCGDVCISENPNGILSNLIDQTSFNYVAAQNSVAQVDTSSFNFQCFFAERQPLSRIVDDFGRLAATYYWSGDSGYLNSRTYQESGIVTSSIDYTLTQSDIVRDSLIIRDDPIGSIYYQTKKVRRINFEYDYNFTFNRYNRVETKNKTNNAFCNTADASGVQKESRIKTKYVIESSTALFCVNNEIRRSTLSEVIVEGILPGRFIGIEIADIVRIKTPSLLNSDSLFQITKVSPDYQIGEVEFTANEILNIT